MKKKWMISLIAIVIAGICVYFALVQPKLDADLAATTGHKKSVVIDLDNGGFHDIKLQKVVVNGKTKPDIAKLQGDGDNIVISDTFDEKGVNFFDYKTTPIPPTKYEKDGTKSIDTGYYLSLHDKSEIQSVDITYTYLGKTFHSGLTIN